MSTREIYLEGLSPWGFRMNGGADVGHPLRISRVNPGSKAALKGVREGDLITSINGQSTKCLTNSESHALLRTVKENLRLGLNEDKNVSPKRRSRDISKQALPSSDKDTHAVTSSSPSSNKGNDKGEEKPSSSKSRRQRRAKLKNRLKQIFGLGKSDLEEEDEVIVQESEITTPPNNSISNISTNSENHICTEEEKSDTKTFISYTVEETKVSTENIYDNCRFLNKHDEMKDDPDPGTPSLELRASDANIGREKTETFIVKEVSTDMVSTKFERDSPELEEFQGKIIRKTIQNEQLPENDKYHKHINNYSYADHQRHYYIQNEREVYVEEYPRIEEVKNVKIIVHSPEECTMEFVDSNQNLQGEVIQNCFQPNTVLKKCNAVISVQDENKHRLHCNDISNPVVPFKEEENFQCFLETLDLPGSEFEDQIEINSCPYGSTQHTAQYMHYLPVRRYLEVISEENSDVSEVDKPWENSAVIKKNNDIDGIPQDWVGSQDGIDTSWQDGKSLEEISDVQVISDSPSDIDMLLEDIGKEQEQNEISLESVSKEVKAFEKSVNQDSRLLTNVSVKKEKGEKKENHYVNIPQEFLLNRENTDCSVKDTPKIEARPIPSIDVVKNVVSSYYNHKYKPESVNLKCESLKPILSEEKTCGLEVQSSHTRTSSFFDDVELVYIDTSDSDVISVKSEIAISKNELNLVGQEVENYGIDSTITDPDSVSNNVEGDKTEYNIRKYECHMKENEVDAQGKFAKQDFKNLPFGDSSIVSHGNEYAQSQRKNEKYKHPDIYPVSSDAAISVESDKISKISEREMSEGNTFTRIDQTFQKNSSFKKEKQTQIVEIETGNASSGNHGTECTSSCTNDDFKEEMTVNSIQSLKDLSANVIVSLPCGNKILNELGVLYKEPCDSLSDYCLETSEYSPYSSGTNLASLGSEINKSLVDLYDDKRNENVDYPESSTSSGFIFISDPKMLRGMGSIDLNNLENDKKWVGMPLADNPGLVLCVSPAQSKHLTSNSNMASDLLDLHTKFIYRRGYHEKSTRPQSNSSEPDLISIDFNQKKDVDTYIPEILFQAEYLMALKQNENLEKNNYNNECEQLPQKSPNKPKETLNVDTDFNVSIVTVENKPDKYQSISDVSMNQFNTMEYPEKEINKQNCVGNSSSNVEPNQPVGNSRLLELIQYAQGESSFSVQDSIDLDRPLISSLATVDEMRDQLTESESDAFQLIEKSATDQLKMSSRSNESNNVMEEKENQRFFDAVKYRISKKGDIAIYDNRPSEKVKKGNTDRPKSLPPGETFRQKMYEEYMDKVAERSERRQQKVIKLSNVQGSGSGSIDMQHLESEFMKKVKERMLKLGLENDEQEDKENTEQNEQERSDDLPKHVQELMEIMEGDGVWSPVHTPETERKKYSFPLSSDKKEEKEDKEEEPQPPVWSPPSAGASPTLERKFRSINFQSPPLKRKEYKTVEDAPELPKNLTVETSFETKSRLVTSTSENSTLSTQLRLPPAQNPTITLLQKAREGQIPKGAQYLESRSEQNLEKSPLGPVEIVYNVKKEYKSDSEESPKRIIELTPRKFEGIGPVTRDGTPIALRSEVKEDNHQKWYKRMYDSLHRAELDKDYVTVKYRTKRKGQYPYVSAGGYLSEPERLTYDSDASISKYATLDRRRIRNRDHDFTTSTMPRSRCSPAVKHAVDMYKNQPGRIEDYEPGHSSISEKETKQWWDEVMDIFDEGLSKESKGTTATTRKPFTYAFKDTGYESDSTLVFRRRDNNMDVQLMSPAEQKTAYKVIQKGGEVPLHGLRKPAPERPKDSPHRYLESEVNIHYRSPVRTEAKAAWPEEELAQKQAEVMRRIYQEQRRTKYLNELQDMYSRRHTDNFIPSQKSPIPLNRYDDFPVETQPPRPRDRTPEPKLVARALYNFVGQTSRELSFRRGDIIFVRRQIDKNWYEGEHNAMIGLFPFNYVEIIPYDGIRTLPKKSTEGQARAKFNFQAQTNLELSLVKGELVLLTRRVDENWFEGRIGNRKGIFPVSYVEVLVEPGEKNVSPTGPFTNKPLVAPASHSVMLNGAKDLGQQHYQPPRPAIYSTASLPSKHKMNEISLVSQALHIDTRSDPVPYRVLYNYKPQNDDELELREGDIVYVMEKCDDGWYVGSLHRNGQFGTFPGNYVERIQ